MAVSAVGVFAAYTSSTAAPTNSYVAVVRNITAGQQLTAADITLVPLDLPVAQREASFSDPELLIGATALSPLGAGQLVSGANVARPDGGDGRAQISVAVAPGSALNGADKYLKPGELVDVIATFGGSGAPETRTVSRSAVVVEAFAGGAALGGAGAVTVVLAVPPDDLEPIAHASAVATLTVARTTGLDRPAPAPAMAGAGLPPEPGPGEPVFGEPPPEDPVATDPGDG